MDLMSKRKLKKVFKDMGASRKEFEEAWRDVYGKEDSELTRKAAVGSLVGLSILPSLALADSPPAEVEKVKEEKKEEKKVSKFFTGTYYQGIKGPSIARFEGGSDGLPMGLEAYGLLDLESDDKKPGLETVFGEFRLSKKLYKDLRLSTRSIVSSEFKDILMLGLRYSPKIKDGDVLMIEYYPLRTEENQMLYVYVMKKLADGKFFVDIFLKGTMDFYRSKKIYSEIGCGMDLGGGLELVAQGRLATGGYKALLLGGRYSF